MSCHCSIHTRRLYCPNTLLRWTARTHMLGFLFALQILLGCMNDDWDLVRSTAVNCLLLLPTPLPGFGTEEQLYPLLRWACHLVDSPRCVIASVTGSQIFELCRLRENDCGARIILLLYKKYVVSLGWSVTLFPEIAVKQMDADSTSRSNQIMLLHSVIERFNSNIKKGELYAVTALQRCTMNLFRGGRSHWAVSPWHGTRSSTDSEISCRIHGLGIDCHRQGVYQLSQRHPKDIFSYDVLLLKALSVSVAGPGLLLTNVATDILFRISTLEPLMKTAWMRRSMIQTLR